MPILKSALCVNFFCLFSFFAHNRASSKFFKVLLSLFCIILVWKTTTNRHQWKLVFLKLAIKWEVLCVCVSHCELQMLFHNYYAVYSCFIRTEAVTEIAVCEIEWSKLLKMGQVNVFLSQGNWAGWKSSKALFWYTLSSKHKIVSFSSEIFWLFCFLMRSSLVQFDLIWLFWCVYFEYAKESK